MRGRGSRLAAYAVAAVLVTAGCGQPGAGDGDAPVIAAQAPLTQDEVLPTGPACSPTGAHGKHASLSCATCHNCGGVLQFDAAGPAVSGTTPSPTFDATAKTCTVACHGVPAGTFTYYWSDYDGNLYPESIPYGGGASPSWYTVGAGCTGCHGNPPSNYQWHGHHGGGNSCEICHPDAVSVNGVAVGLSTATNCGPNGTYGVCANLHRNGSLDVWPRWKSTCFGCH